MGHGLLASLERNTNVGDSGQNPNSPRKTTVDTTCLAVLPVRPRPRSGASGRPCYKLFSEGTARPLHGAASGLSPASGKLASLQRWPRWCGRWWHVGEQRFIRERRHTLRFTVVRCRSQSEILPAMNRPAAFDNTGLIRCILTRMKESPSVVPLAQSRLMLTLLWEQ